MVVALRARATRSRQQRVVRKAEEAGMKRVHARVRAGETGEPATTASTEASKNVRVTSFQSLVYAAAKRIPKGRVTTYGLLAKSLGRPKASRAVGAALAANPFAPVVPCHRVIAGDGTIGGFFHQCGLDQPLVRRKLDMLRDEGVCFADGKLVDRSAIIALENDADAAADTLA